MDSRKKFIKTEKILKASKPEVVFDESFSKNLRMMLVNAPRTTHHSDQKQTLQPLMSHVGIVSSYISQWMTLSGKISSGIAGAALALLIAIPATYLATRQAQDINFNSPVSVKDSTSELSLKQQINDKGTNAFGKLAVLPSDVQPTASSSTSQNVVVSTDVPDTTTTTGSETTSLVSSSTPVSTVFSYTYSGDTLKVDSDTGTVFKRDKGTDAGKQLATFIQGSNFGLTNLGTFSNLNLKALELAENNAEGYTLGINFDDSVVTISSNGANGQVPGENSATSSSPTDDAAFISKATNFLTSHKVDMSSYADPYLIHSSDIPQTVTILYPLILRGQDVYDELGNRYGMQVTVDINTQKVIAVNNLASQMYESSLYTLETDSVHILSKIPKTIPAVAPADAKIIPVTLGTPRKVLMRTLVAESDGSVSELYVPALLFSDTAAQNAPNIIIPLLKDTLGKSAVKTIVASTSPAV